MVYCCSCYKTKQDYSCFPWLPLRVTTVNSNLPKVPRLTFTFTAKVIKSPAGPPTWRNQLSLVKRNEHWLDNVYYNKFYLQSLQLHARPDVVPRICGPPTFFSAFKLCLSQVLELVVPWIRMTDLSWARSRIGNRSSGAGALVFQTMWAEWESFALKKATLMKSGWTRALQWSR